MPKAGMWLRTTVMVLVGLGIGSGLLWWGDRQPPDYGLRILAFNVGSFLIASVVMALIFEFWQLRGLVDELYANAGIADQLRKARISGFSTAFHAHVPWPELFAQTEATRILFAYGRTWRNTHRLELEAFLTERGGTKIEVVLPDRKSPRTVLELAARFSTTPETVVERIEDAENFFRALDNGRSRVRVFAMSRTPTYSCYLFDTRAVFATYRHREEQGSIVTITVDKGGDMYQWLLDEWTGITKKGVDDEWARQTYPEIQE